MQAGRATSLLMSALSRNELACLHQIDTPH
jgi:hypothetical protein